MPHVSRGPSRTALFTAAALIVVCATAGPVRAAEPERVHASTFAVPAVPPPGTFQAFTLDRIGTTVASTPLYQVRTFPLQELPWEALQENGKPLSRYAASGPVDADGVPLHRYFGDGKLYYYAGVVARQGMQRLDSYVRTLDAGYLPTLQLLDASLREHALVARNAWWYAFDFTVKGERLKAPWFNAMTNGLVLSFFVRMYRVFGDPADLAAATMIFRSFQKLSPGTPWVGRVDGRGYLWLEHYPGGVHLKVLNAHMYALFGLYEYWQLTTARHLPVVTAARRVLEGAITTIKDNGWRFRRPGQVSRYCLIDPTWPEKYHLIHITQLRLLASLSGDLAFTRLAADLEADYSEPGPSPTPSPDPSPVESPGTSPAT